MPRKRSLFLSAVLVVASFLILTAKKIYDYAARPVKEKESDFVFPHDPPREQPALRVADAQWPPLNFAQRGGFINDASHLNKTAIYGVVRVSKEDDIHSALAFARAHKLKVSCAGQKHSMGGQAFTPGGLVLDLRDFRAMHLDKQRKRVTIQAGARWWQLQELLDKEGLSVKAMQSINTFSVGGSLSVNAHGIDPMPGPLAPTVRSLRIMLSNGQVVKASPTENAELFSHVLGGYGLFGVILDADLDVVENEVYARRTLYMDYQEFPGYYQTNVEGNGNIGLIFARLSVAPQSFLRETAVHVYRKAQFAGALPPLESVQHNTLERFVINFSKTGSMGRWLRWELEKYAEPHLHNCLTRNQAINPQEACEVSRNSEMYDDMAYLQNQMRDTDILQEYFVSFGRMAEFVDGLRQVVEANHANLLNVTIRTVHKDTLTALPYARQDMFALVLYFNVRFNDRDNKILEKTTTNLIDLAERVGGTFYLPYQLFYSSQQLRQAYPRIDQFFAAKKRYDPIELFSNQFYEKYGM